MEKFATDELSSNLLLKEDFPIFGSSGYDNALVYLDNASTTQKPRKVIDSMSNFYEKRNANVHRGAYRLSELATQLYENARNKVKNFINAGDNEVIFVRGTTEAINLVASSYSDFFQTGDEIIVSEMEHHANIVPWQIICQKLGTKLRVIPVNDTGELLIDSLKELINVKTRFVSIPYASNVLGTINPVREIVKICHNSDVPVLVDAAQAASHIKIDVSDLDCDFLAFSAHKMYGPTGIGVLYGKKKWLDMMPPYQSGGDMIASVSFEETKYNDLPYKFEAGTPNIAGAIGFGEAIDYISAIGLSNIQNHEQELLVYATELLNKIDGLQIIGNSREKIGVISFVINDVHPHDISTILDNKGIAIRAGHHCAQPLMNRFCVPAMTRISFAVYNTKEDIDAAVAVLQEIRELFK